MRARVGVRVQPRVTVGLFAAGCTGAGAMTVGPSVWCLSFAGGGFATSSAFTDVSR